MSTNIDVGTLPSIALADRGKLPDKSGVYFVLTEEGEILYVGSGLSLRHRWTGHHRTQQLKGTPGTRIAWQIVEEATRLREIERELIELLRPPLNDSPVEADAKGCRLYSMELPARLIEQLDSVAKWNHRSRQGEMAVAIEEHVRRENKKRSD